MQRGKWRVVPAAVAVGALVALAGGSAAATAPAKAKKSCQLLKPAEITSAFAIEAGDGQQQGSDCTWKVGDWALSLELTTKAAKSTFEGLRDLAKDAGAPTQKITHLGDQAVFAPIESFKELLVLKGKKFLFFRVLDIASPMDTDAARTALVEVAKKAVKRV
jgi:hypothetical protein